MGLKCGIVGLPNVGKSTLFNALTQSNIEASNYPFCTIDPNVGMIAVPDSRLDQLENIVSPQKTIPTMVEIVDIAGLVKGASKGEGLGNKFLANIRECDAILHVVRCFENTDVTHVAGKISPLDDIEIINTELQLADLETVGKALLKANKNAKSGNKEATQEKQLLEKIENALNNNQPIRALSLNENEQQILQRFQLISAKKVLYIANVAEDGFENNTFLDTVTAYAKQENAGVLAISAAIEAEIQSLAEEERADFLNELGQSEPGLNRLIRTSYALLDLQTYFTAGPKEVRAWTTLVGATAPKAAAAIHTDFEKGFIRAEVVSFNDYIEHQGEQGAKAAGKLRSEGKTYIVQDGDVMHFLFNV